MSFLDHLRQKWKHSDPAVREQAVRDLEDQEILEKVAAEDPHEAVRLAAVERLTDQFALARFARGNDSLALPAMKRLSDRAQLVGVAQFAQLREVREMAVDRIDDRIVLHRIATSDTDPSVRWKARCRNLGSDETREVIRGELAKLQLAQNKLEQVAEFCGTLDDVCSALIGDERFRINGAVEANELGLATIRELEAPKPEASGANATPAAANPFAAPAARFLAAKRMATAGPDDATVTDAFFEISVWRTDDNTFACQMEEKRRHLVHNSVVWSRVSNGATGSAINKNTTPGQPNSRIG